MSVVSRCSQEGKGTLMGFDIHTALQLAWEDGLLIRRDAWDAELVIWADAQTNHLSFTSIIGTYIPSEDDLNAEDWSVSGAVQ